MADITGPQGIRGPQGERGETIINFITVTGARGPQGEKGDNVTQIGGQGYQGYQGYQGRQGTQGYQGTTGQGTQGTQGLQGTQGTHRNSAGITDTDPIVSPIESTLNFTVSAATGVFYNNNNFAGYLYTVNIPAVLLTAVENLTNYLYAEYNGTTAEYKVTTNVDLINESNTIPINTMLLSDGYFHLSHWDRMADGMTNKLHRRLVKTQRYVKEPGSGLTISPDGLSVSSGVVWRGARDFHLNNMSFGGAQDFWFHYYDDAGWSYNVNVAPYNNTQYGNSENGPQTLTDGYYTINWMFRGVEDHNHIYYTLSNKEFKDRPTAIAETTIPPLPSQISSHAILIGRIIVQKDSTDLTIEMGSGETFTGTVINEHNELAGLNSGEFQHLTQLQLEDVIYHNHQAGIDGQPGWTPVGDGTFTVDSGEAWFYTDGSLEKLIYKDVVGGNILTPIDDTTNYVCAYWDGVSPTAEWIVITNLSTIDYINYVPYFIVFKRTGGTTLHVQNVTLFAHSETEKHHSRVLECSRYDKAPSALLGLAVDTSLNITLDGGGVWTVNKRYEIEPVTIDTDHHVWENLGGGVWNLAADYVGPLANNTQYNGPTGFVELSDPSKWTINYIYRGIEDQNHTYMVLDTNEYDTVELAKASNLVGSLPPMILAHAMFVGRIIVQKNAVTDIVCESAFDTVFAASTPVSEHNALSNKQGGQTSEYYHLEAVQHDTLVGGTGTDANSLHIHPHDHDHETIQPDVVLFHTPDVTPTGVGSTYWDDNYKCLATKTSPDTSIQHGQEIVVYCHNESGVNISNGEAVSSLGGDDRNPNIELFNAVGEYHLFGITTQAINNGDYGFVTIIGNVNGLSTDGSNASPPETWNNGDIIYASNVQGKLTNVKPVAPVHMSRVGIVTFKDNSDGTLFVSIDNGYELEELHNVLIVTGTAGNSIVLDNDGIWKNRTINQTDVGLSEVDNTSDLDKPLSNAVTGALELKVDKVSGASLMYDADILRLANTSGTNSGDQDLSGYTLNTTTINGYQLTGTVQLTNADISGVEFVDNTSDLDKPLSNAVTGALELKVPFTLLDETRAWTGFLNPAQIDESYDYTTRTITLTGDLTYYWRGVKGDLISPWTSDPHDDVVGVYYLYDTDGSGFVWSTGGWDITDMQMVRVNYKTSAETSFAVKETHGVMDPALHEYLHNRLKSYCSSGGNAINVVTNIYTDGANAVAFDGASVTDEDLTTYIPEVLGGGLYTRIHVGITGIEFSLNNTLPFIHGGNNTYLQVNNPNDGSLVDAVDGNYYNIYQILVPVTSDVSSQAYRMVFLQPQRTFTNLLSAQMEPLDTLVLSNIGANSAEYVVHTRVTYFTKADETNKGKCCIPSNGVSIVNRVSSQLNQHEQLSNLSWTDSGHTGDVNTVAGFDGTGQSYFYGVTGNINFPLVTTNAGIWDTKADLIGGKVPIGQLPEGSLTYEEYATFSAFPVTGSDTVVYTAIDTSLSYRWSGTVYVISSSALVLGETSQTAYRGDRGKIAYDHSQLGGGTGTNPHGTTLADIGAAPANKGVTNGDTHDHNGGDGGQIDYGTLSGLPTLGTAAATSSSDYAVAAKGVTNGDSHDHLGGDGGQIAYTSITGTPVLGTAAYENIPATGDASITEVVYGTDTRLTDSRTPLAHNQAESTITFTDITTGNSTTGAHGYFPKLPTPTGNYLRDDMTWQTLTNSTVGLGNVTNNAQYYAGGQIIPVSDGGIGVGSITGILFGNGTSPVTTAIPRVDYEVPALYARVVTTNATTTGQTLTDITGLTLSLQANTVYEIYGVLSVQSTSNAGNRYGIQFTGAGATLESSIMGVAGNATTNRNERIIAFNTQTGLFVTSANGTGGVNIQGIISVGANAGTLSIRHLKETSGTSTVFINSFLKVSKIV